MRDELSAVPELSSEAQTTRPQTANDFACIATLGTGGCGFEQQLEAPLKALWPSLDPMPNPDGSNRIKFLGDTTGNGTLGHGDGENAGFLRNDPSQGLSLIAIIVVTDEEDCSSSTPITSCRRRTSTRTTRWRRSRSTCAASTTKKTTTATSSTRSSATSNGFKALRPGNENLVIFAAIAGVPPDLVDQTHLANVDFSDEAQRDAFYENILDDPRMQETVDPAYDATPGAGNLLPSCTTDTGKAYPPRRIVQVAQQFGANGIVQSICQDDFGPALDAIIDMIGKQLGAVCLPRRWCATRTGSSAATWSGSCRKRDRRTATAPDDLRRRPAGSSCSSRAPATPSNRIGRRDLQGRPARREGRRCRHIHARADAEPTARSFRRAGSTTTSRTR